MSGIIGSKINIKGSGIVAQLGTDGQVLTSAGAGIAAEYEDLAGGISWQSVETGSTMTAVAGNGYPINTTSNACTITLPASASAGDTIVFTDYARNWGTNGIVIDSNGLNYQGDADTYTVEYTTDGQSVQIVYADSTKGWVPINDDDVTDVPAAPSSNQNGLFGYGDPETGITNIVSNVGVVASDVSGVGTAREELAACGYGNDKAIFGFGRIDSSDTLTGVTNLVNNSGVVASDVSAVGTARRLAAGATYGGDKGIFGFGTTGSYTAVSNLVSNSGVVASDVSGVGTARAYLAACSYGADKDTAIFAYGIGSSMFSLSNLVNNSGVVGADVTGVGTARRKLGACEYGGDKGIFGYGNGLSSVTNLVSNVGVIGTDVTGVGTAREETAACDYGLDKGIFGYGSTGSDVSMSNLVSNVGVVAADVTGVGTARAQLAGTQFN